MVLPPSLVSALIRTIPEYRRGVVARRDGVRAVGPVPAVLDAARRRPARWRRSRTGWSGRSSSSPACSVWTRTVRRRSARCCATGAQARAARGRGGADLGQLGRLHLGRQPRARRGDRARVLHRPARVGADGRAAAGRAAAASRSGSRSGSAPSRSWCWPSGTAQVPWVALVLAFSFSTYGLVKKLADVPARSSRSAVETSVTLLPALAYVVRPGGDRHGDVRLAGRRPHAAADRRRVVSTLPLLAFGGRRCGSRCR